MKDKGTIALSSLAFGVGAAALLGVSEESEADPPGYYCAVGEPGCYLGAYTMMGSVHWHPWFDDNPAVQASVLEAIMAQGWNYFNYATQDVYGSCVPAPSSCGCAGTYWVWDLYVGPYGSPSYGSGTIYVTAHHVPKWAGRAHEPACYIPI